MNRVALLLLLGVSASQASFKLELFKRNSPLQETSDSFLHFPLKQDNQMMKDVRDMGSSELLASVSFGKQKNLGQLSVSTSSDFTAINQLTCDACKNKIYDESQGQNIKKDQTIELGNLEGFGDLVLDDVSFIPDKTKPTNTIDAEIQFLALSKPLTNKVTQKTLPDTDGVLGLGFNNDQKQSFIQYASPLDKKKFSIFLNKTYSALSMGSFDNSFLADGEENQGYGWHTFDLTQKDSWTVEMQDARYIYMTFLKSGANKARISTNDEYIYIPNDDFSALKDAWKGKSADIKCPSDLNFCFINQTCQEISHTIGPFKIQFSTNEYFSVESDEFTYNGKDFGPYYENQCVFGVMSSELATKNNEFILGQAFLRNYLTGFDVDKKTISFGIHQNSTAAVRKTFSGGIIALLAISTALFFPLFVLGIYFLIQFLKRGRRQREKEAREQEKKRLMSDLDRSAESQ
ncbi:eukaryotic aspartyl protease family protein [Stylonychia lemnae]|uniref:Eukaryotic aspartyl protease family protein n=1 Tax=Stylonychia lemnae TaxID=5949 RepID=A0A078AUY7_STYLE|nr:eukaryotic aspartyl protease family protein [Stylonychia lemnae]|eukprot:CDW86019.1 eukaryotic aspartyl protease family protein [Stylonychia lemnae]